MKRLGLAWVLLAALAASCTTPPQTVASPSPSGPVTARIDDKTKGELQAVLKAQNDALEKRDLSGYQRTYDQGRAAFRRCISMRRHPALATPIPSA